MWTGPSASCWIGLLTLAGVMLFSAPEAYTFIDLPCCYNSGSWIRKPVAECVLQLPRKGCYTTAYMVKPLNGQWSCIKPDSKWLEKKLKQGSFTCHLDIRSPGRKAERLGELRVP